MVNASVLTKAPEERKRIGREVRKAARKEKKKIKSDAKKQRKENDILHRRMVSPNPARARTYSLLADANHSPAVQEQ